MNEILNKNEETKKRSSSPLSTSSWQSHAVSSCGVCRVWDCRADSEWDSCRLSSDRWRPLYYSVDKSTVTKSLLLAQESPENRLVSDAFKPSLFKAVHWQCRSDCRSIWAAGAFSTIISNAILAIVYMKMFFPLGMSQKKRPVPLILSKQSSPPQSLPLLNSRILNIVTHYLGFWILNSFKGVMKSNLLHFC